MSASYPVRVKGVTFLVYPSFAADPYEAREITGRKLAAARRAVKKSQQAIPLFPELARWQSVEQRMEAMEQRNYAYWVYWRQVMAGEIRRVRRKLAAAEVAQVQALQVRWATRGGGFGLHFLLDMLWQAGFRQQ
jgi:hypothetical protein